MAMMKRAQQSLLLIAVTLLAACASPPKPSPAGLAADRHVQTGSRLYQAGQLAEARSAFQRGIRAAELIDDSQRLVNALLASAASELLLGDFIAADGNYRRAQQEASREGLAGAAVQAAIGLAETARQRGDHNLALSQFRAIKGKEGLTVEQRGQLDNGMALCLMATGELAAAEHILVLLEPVSSEASEALHASTLANLARLRLLQGRLPLAESLAGQALSIDRRLFHPPAIAADHLLLGEILRLAGRQEDAQRHVDTAGRIYRQTGQVLPR